MALIEVRGLEKSFVHMGRTLRVLRGIDVTIEQGEVVAIVGPSGAGKSTLLHCIGTLDLPTSGSIHLGGEELTGLSGAKLAAIRNRTIGFVFQFHHLLPEFNALENVMMPLLATRGRPEPWMAERADELLAAVGLAEHAAKRPGQLSGGQQQRVAVARALVARPRLVLADEPTGNLDTRTADEVFASLRRFNVEQGIAFLVVTHDPRLADRCDRTVELVDGRVVDDRPRELPRA